MWLYETAKKYEHGENFCKIDRNIGLILICTAANAGHPVALAECHELGLKSYKVDVQKAIAMFQKSEHPRAQFLLAEHYIKRNHDWKMAFELLTKSASQGHCVALHLLGVCYENGKGCEKNLKNALEYYYQSADLGYCGAMHALGFVFHYGTCRMDIDLVEAKMWYTRAADQGYEKSKRALEICEFNSDTSDLETLHL